MALPGTSGPSASPSSVPVVSAISPIVALLVSTSGASAAQMIPAWTTGKTYLKGDVVLVGSGATAPCWVCVQSGTTTSSVAGPSAALLPPSASVLNALFSGLGILSVTVDGAVWLPVASFGNGISIANIDSSNTLTFGFDSTITASSTAIVSIGVGGAPLTFNYSGLPASLWAVGSAKFSLVGQP